MLKKVKSIRKKVVNKLGDVLSYPQKTLHDARAMGFNEAADAMRLRREKLKAYKKRGGAY